MDILNKVSWFKKYQPKSVEDYVFENEQNKNNVIQWIEEGSIPGNILLYGPAGTGKSALAYLLIHGIIKSQHDIKKVKDKGVKSIDELHIWAQKAPVSSKKKIIYIEEVDRCSREAFNALKDGLMENYQDHISFLCTTNWLSRIEHAVQTRFNYKFNLESTNLFGTYARLANILNTEKIQWTEDELKVYVENNISLGLRDMINNLQINVVNDKINFANIKLQKSDQENRLIELTISIIDKIINSQDINDKMMILKMPLKSSITVQWASIIELINYNYEINYETVFLEIQERNSFGPLLPIIDRYLNSMDGRKFPHVHYQGFLYEMMRCVLDISI